jgi:hypothetical protein
VTTIESVILYLYNIGGDPRLRGSLEVILDYEAPEGSQNETVIKEHALTA